MNTVIKTGFQLGGRRAPAVAGSCSRTPAVVASPRFAAVTCSAVPAFSSSAVLTQRCLHTTVPRWNEQQQSSASSGQKGTPIGQIDARLSLTFTCAVQDCGHRSSHEFSKRSYEKGIVIVQCPQCKNRHLIADHFSWFHDQSKTVEQLVKEKGGRVRRGNMLAADGQDQGETMEILSDTEAEQAGGSDGGFKGS
ncbi:unnamed protein product [Jaminaea pallidilutea]